MVDLHSHLLWGIDDGSKSREMSLNMLKQAVEGGTKKLVVTPHYLPGHYEVPIDIVRQKSEDLRELAKEEALDTEIYSGQEVYFTSNLLDNFESNLIGTINNSRYMLIEFNMKSFSVEEVVNVLYELQLKGIVPIIAHPERYSVFIKNPSLINEFIREGFLFQLNLGSLIGDFGKEVKKTADIFLENKIYSFIGSDAHRDENRNPNMSKGKEILLLRDKVYFDYLMNCSEKLLRDEEIIFKGAKLKVKRGLFSLFSKY